MEARDRIRGCLLAGAVGDALGAPVEFMSLGEIRERHGRDGIADLERGLITDDTQMALFTAEGMIRGLVRSSHYGIAHVPSITHRSYLRWLTTQGGTPEIAGNPGWLVGVEGLHARRAPGNTCLSALGGGSMGTIEAPVNDSKGCGGVMRAAPVGLTTAVDPFRLGADTAALTHGHPSGYLPAGFLAALVARLFAGEPLPGALDATRAELLAYDGHEETLAALDAARALAAAGGDPSPEKAESLGGGWVGEEALAIAVYAALAAPALPAALRLAVNHSGDSDSTGAIAGNILGTVHGEAAIPRGWLERLELRDVIEQVADDLAEAFHGQGVGGEYEPYDERVERFFERYPGA